MTKLGQQRPRENLVRAMRAAAEAVRLADLGGEALESLRSAVCAGGVLLYRYGDHGEMEFLGGNLVSAMGLYSADMARSDPLQQQPRRMPRGAKVVPVTNLVVPAELHRSAAYHDFYHRTDLEHVICTWIIDDRLYGSPGMAGILLARSHRQPQFSASETALLARALPALTAAAHRCRKIEAEDRDRRALDATLAGAVQNTTLVLDAMGRLRWVSNAAERLLGAALGAGGALPEPLVCAARKLGALAMEREPSVMPTFDLELPLPTGTSLGATLSLSRRDGGEPLVVVDLTPPKAAPRFAALAAQHRLTRAETRVLKDLADGLSNAKIAERRHVSVETVRTHVARTLAKLDVPSRVQAALIARDVMS